MIRELVALHLSRAASTSMGGARDNLADKRREDLGAVRRNRGA